MNEAALRVCCLLSCVFWCVCVCVWCSAPAPLVAPFVAAALLRSHRQRSATNCSAKDSRIPSLSSSEEMNPPNRQQDCDISPLSLPQPNSDPLNLPFGSNSSADELLGTGSASANPSTSAPCALPANNGCALNAAVPMKSAHICNHTEHTIPAGTNLTSAHNPSMTKVNRTQAGGHGGQWRIGYTEHTQVCISVRVLFSSFRMLHGAALPQAVELSPDGMGPVCISVMTQATAMRSKVFLSAR